MAISNIVCVHDADYFPHNNMWGEEISEIKFKPKNKFFYGKGYVNGHYKLSWRSNNVPLKKNEADCCCINNKKYF